MLAGVRNGKRLTREPLRTIFLRCSQAWGKAEATQGRRRECATTNLVARRLELIVLDVSVPSPPKYTGLSSTLAACPSVRAGALHSACCRLTQVSEAAQPGPDQVTGFVAHPCPPIWILLLL